MSSSSGNCALKANFTFLETFFFSVFRIYKHTVTFWDCFALTFPYEVSPTVVHLLLLFNTMYLCHGVHYETNAEPERQE